MSIFGSANLRKCRVFQFGSIMMLVMIAVLPMASQTQHAKPSASEPTPQPAISAILAAFDQYEVVALPEAHGMKDTDDFILSLIRDPALPIKVTTSQWNAAIRLFSSTTHFTGT